MVQRDRKENFSNDKFSKLFYYTQVPHGSLGCFVIYADKPAGFGGKVVSAPIPSHFYSSQFPSVSSDSRHLRSGTMVSPILLRNPTGASGRVRSGHGISRSQAGSWAQRKFASSCTPHTSSSLLLVVFLRFLLFKKTLQVFELIVKLG